jgi:hypothetical protein
MALASRPGENDIVAWGISAPEHSSEVSVAGSIGPNIVSFDILARIGRSHAQQQRRDRRAPPRMASRTSRPRCLCG